MAEKNTCPPCCARLAAMERRIQALEKALTDLDIRTTGMTRHQILHTRQHAAAVSSAMDELAPNSARRALSTLRGRDV